MVICPECGGKLTRQTGGNTAADGSRSAYRYCGNDDCKKFMASVRTLTRPHQPEQFAGWVDNDEMKLSPREALRILRGKVRDDREWFRETTEETEEFARQIFGIVWRKR